MVVIKGLPDIDGGAEGSSVARLFPNTGLLLGNKWIRFLGFAYSVTSGLPVTTYEWNTLCGYEKNIFQKLVPLLGFLSDYYIENGNSLKR